MEIKREIKLTVVWQPCDIQTLSNLLEVVRCATDPLYNMNGKYRASYGLTDEEVGAVVRLKQKLVDYL